MFFMACMENISTDVFIVANRKKNIAVYILEKQRFEQPITK